MYAYDINEESVVVVKHSLFREHFGFELFGYKVYPEKVTEVDSRVILLAVPAKETDDHLPRFIGHFTDIYKRIERE